MTLISAADIDYALGDIGVPVSFSAQSAFGIFRREDVLEDDGQGGFVTVSRRVLTLRDGKMTGLADDASITIDGTVYRIRKVLDGSPQLVRLTVV